MIAAVLVFSCVLCAFPLLAQPAGWTQVTPIQGYNMTANASTVYLATGGEFHRSFNNGATWTQSPQSPLGAITGFHINGSTILALQEFSGVWKSFDNGASWFWTSYNGTQQAARTAPPAARSSNQTFFTNSCMGGDGNTVFIASASDNVYRSLDGGNSWVIVSSNLPRNSEGRVAIQPQDMSVGFGTVFMAGGWLHRSTNNGSSWENVAPVGETAVRSVWHDATSVVIYSGFRKIYRSTDNGASWTQTMTLPTAAGNSGGRFVEGNDVLFLVSESNGVWYSHDKGLTWLIVPNSLILPGGPLAGAATSTDFFLTLSGGGTYRYNYASLPRAEASFALSGNAGIANTTLTLTGSASRTTTASATGAYSFSGLANGTYTITPSLAGAVFAPLLRTVTVNNASMENINFQRILPSLTIAPSAVNFGSVTLGTVSTSSFSVSGQGLTSAVTLASSPSAYSLSLTNSPFTTQANIMLSLVNNTLAATQVFVRFSPSVTGASIGAVSVSGGSTASIVLSGNGLPVPPPPVLRAAYAGVRTPIDPSDVQTFTVTFRNAANALVDYAGSVDFRGGTPLGTSTGTLALTRLSLGTYQTSSRFAALGNYTLSLNTVTSSTGTRTFTVQAAVNNPVPTLSSIAPTSVTASTSTFTLTLNGSNFIPETQVVVNGVTLATQAVTLLSGAQLKADIVAPQAGITNVWVFNPAPSGGTSATRTLAVNHPAPILGSITPTSIRAGEETVITLIGAYFTTATVVRITRGSTTSTLSFLSLVSPNQATVRVPAGYFTTSATYQVAVQTPVFGGGTSSAQNLAVTGTAAVTAEFVSVTTNVVAGANIAAFSVRLRDVYGNLTDSHNITNVNFTEQTGASSGTLSLTRTGAGTLSVVPKRFYESGQYNLWLQGISTTTGSRTFTVTGAGDNRVTISGVPTSIQAGSQLPSFTLRFEDSFGNLTDNGIGTLRFTKAGTPASTATLTMTRVSEGIYTAQSMVLTVAGTYSLAVSSVNAVNTLGTKSFAVNPSNAPQTDVSGLTLYLAAGARQAAFDVRFRDVFGNLTDAGIPSMVNYSNSTNATNGVSTGTIAVGARVSIGLYDMARVTFTTAGNYEVGVNGFVNTGARAFTVVPLVALTAEFAGVPASIRAGSELPAFTVTYRDTYGNLVNYGGTVMYRNTSNATVMGSFVTTATSVGVVTTQPLVFAGEGNFALSVGGILAGNVRGNRGFVVIREPEERCGTSFSIDNLSPQELERKQILDDIQAQLMLDPPEMQEENNTTPIVVPVVVHILRTQGMPAISDEDVRTQIDILNQDFDRLNANRVNTPMYFAQFATSANIRFCLAQSDPNGIFTTGINRVTTDETGGWGSGYGLRNELRPKILAPGWDPSRYLNIWVTNLRYTNPEAALWGYANPPHVERAGFATSANVNVIVDGVVVHYKAFGTNTSYVVPRYSLGRTLTHEVSVCKILCK